MREHTDRVATSPSSRIGPAPRSRSAHPLATLQSRAGNHVVTKLIELQRCGPLPHAQCPCDTDDEPQLQRVADRSGVVDRLSTAPRAFTAALPELGKTLAQVHAAEGSDPTERLPSLDQRPAQPTAGSHPSPAPMSQTRLGQAKRLAPVLPPAMALDSGPRPVLSLTGDADPAIARRATDAALGELGARAGESGREAAADFGEGAVAQAAPPVRIRPSPVTVPPVAITAPRLTLTGPETPSMARAEGSLSGWLGERSASASARLHSQESAGRERIDKAVRDSAKRIDVATGDAAARREDVARAARLDVAAERGRWTSGTRALHLQHAESTRSKLGTLHTTVTGIVGEADRNARVEYTRAEQGAKDEQAKNPSLWGRAAGVFASLKQAVSGLFNRAREVATGLFDAARSRVSQLVRAFADAVRAGATAFVERVEAVAARAKAAIAAKVKAAAAAVRKGAAGLLTFGHRILAGAAAAVRASLAAIGKAARAAVETLVKAAAAVKKALDAVGRLVTRLAPYEPLPEGLFEWADRWKRLSESQAGGAVAADLRGAVLFKKPPIPKASASLGDGPKGSDPLGTGPAGGCGVCKGSAANAGTEAHKIVQQQFVSTYAPNAFVEYPIPQKGPGVLEVDLARHRPDGSLAIGEIKPANEQGYTDGVSSIAKYLKGIGDIDPDQRLVPLVEPIPPAFFPNPEGGPGCPDQKLFVFPPVGGVYGYHCLPEYDKLMASGQCKCGKPPPVPVPVTEKKTSKEDEKEKEKEEDAEKESGPALDPAYAKAIAVAIVALCIAVAALLLWPEPIGKAISAVAAVLSFAAIMLMINKAEADGKPTA